MNRYGQYVRLEVYNQSDSLIFKTDSLRIDFEFVSTAGYDRSKVTIYNLKNDTIQQLTNGENYVRIYTKLHDRKEYLVFKNHYVSNAINYIKLPNSITELYCIHKLHKTFLQKKLDIKPIKVPTLHRCINSIVEGTDLTPLYKGFTDKWKADNEVFNENQSRGFSNTVEVELNKLARERNFRWFVKDGLLILTHTPNIKDIKKSDMDTDTKVVKISPDNLKGNPMVSVAHITFTTNLQPEITTTNLIDSNDFITAESKENFDVVAATRDLLHKNVGGYNRYYIVTLQHTGSNYTNNWETTVNAVGVQASTIANPFNWHGTTRYYHG